MSFKNHNNYWHTYIQSEPEVSTEVVIVSVTMGVSDTYITDEPPNYSNIQVFNSGSQEFQTLTEVLDGDLLLSSSTVDSRDAFIRKKIALTTGIPSSGTISTEVGTGIAIGTTPIILIPTDDENICADAIARERTIVKKAQEELADCLNNSNDPDDAPYKKFLDCRQQCKDQLQQDISDWFRECNEIGHGDEIPTTPERNCVNGQPVWNWHSAVSQSCKDSYCELVQKYVRCIGGQDICRYNPCTGNSADPLGGDGNDNGIPPSIFAVKSECWKNNPDADPTKGGDIWDPEDEVSGSPCWTAYYRKILIARCQTDIICKVKNVYEDSCCKGFMFDTNDYCRSLGCVPTRGGDTGRGRPQWGGCGPENKILCLQRKLQNEQKTQECVKTNDGSNPDWNRWYAMKTHQACVELANAIREYEYGNSQTDEERKQADAKYEANVAQCLKDYQDATRSLNNE
jgi:hypothetical protein